MSDRSTSSNSEPSLPMKLPLDTGPLGSIRIPPDMQDMLAAIDRAQAEINALGTLPLALKKDAS